MKRISQLVCGIAIIVMAGTAVSSVYAQSVTARALFTYPMKGQTPEQENADRAACHDWAVAQTGFDPSLVYAAQQAGVPTRTIANVTRRMVVTPGGIGGGKGKGGGRRLKALYSSYLRARQGFFEAASDPRSRKE